MKPIEQQIKDDTKRLLRSQTCSTCAYGWHINGHLRKWICGLLRNENCSTCRHGWYPVNKWYCSRTNSLVPLVHTCYQYERNMDTVLKRD